MMGDTDDDAFGPPCPLCGAEMDREPCWCCHGAGGWHDCGEDCCCCLEPELDLNERCEECGGEGSYWQCPHLPHDREE